MLLPSVPQFRRRRSRRPQVPSAGPPPAPLEIVGIQDLDVGEETGTVTVVFNTTAENPLNDVSASDPEKWSMRYLNQRWGTISFTLLAYNLLQLSLYAPSGDEGGNEIRYANDPSDISDSLGRELPAYWFNF